MKVTSKIGLPPKLCCPHPLKKLPEIFLMTSQLDSHTTTDVKPEMLSGVQPGNGIPHDRYNIRGIAHGRTNRKDHIFMQRRLVQNFTFILEWGQGTCKMTKHTRRWAYSRYHAAYSALWHFFRTKIFILDPIYFLNSLLFFGPKLFSNQNCFQIKIFPEKENHFFTNIFLPKLVFTQIFFWPKNLFVSKLFLTQKFFWTQNFFGPKIFLDSKFSLDPNIFFLLEIL